MSAHRVLQDMAIADGDLIDPGDGGTIVVDKDNCSFHIESLSATESRVLSPPLRGGQQISLSLGTAGGNTITFTQENGGSWTAGGALSLLLNADDEYTSAFSRKDSTGKFVWSIQGNGNHSVS